MAGNGFGGGVEGDDSERLARGRPRTDQVLGPRERAKLAAEMFEPLKKGEAPLSFAALSKKSKAVTGVTLTSKQCRRIVMEVFKSREVALRRVSRPPQHVIDRGLGQELETRLRARFPDQALPNIVVIRGKSDETPREAHAQVGVELAKLLGQKSVWRDNDVIGVGSGRAVWYALDAWRQRERLDRNGISVMSLTGSVFLAGAAMHDDEESDAGLALSLDADSFTPLVAERFTGQVSNYPMQCHFAFTSEAMRNAHIKSRGFKRFLNDHELARRDPSSIHLLIGIGIFYRNHRLYDEVTAPLAKGEVYRPGRRIRASRKGVQKDEPLAPIADLLTALANKVDRIVEAYPTYFPVADICNRLFVVEPPEEVAWTEEGGERAPYNEVTKGKSSSEPLHKRTIAKEDLQLIGDGKPVKDIRAAELKPVESRTITELVNCINVRTATVRKRDIVKTDVFLGAATWPKSRALWHTIKNMPGMIKTLVIDASAATTMIGILKREQ